MAKFFSAVNSSERLSFSVMKFFIDTADIEEIRELSETGLVNGVTTNPSLIAKTNKNFFNVVQEICDIVDGPVSAEVTATEFDDMLAEGNRLASISDNIAVKVPLTPDGLKACKALTDKGIMVNVTLCFSAGQAILAAKAGASFISPFVGRLDDISSNGMELINDICKIYSKFQAFRTEVLVASIRHPIHLISAAKIGAHVATMPPNVLRQLYKHPLTDAGLDAFLADWKKTGQSILDS